MFSFVDPFYQNKIEHFIHEGLRRPMLVGHRQAWVWQDEWYGLTIEDIRHLEEETQQVLAKKMGKLRDGHIPTDWDSDQEGGFASDKNRGSVVYVQHESLGSKLDLLSKASLDESGKSSPASCLEMHAGRSDLQQNETPLVCSGRNQDYTNTSRVKESVIPPKISLKRESISSFESSSGTFQASRDRRLSSTDLLKGWHISCIESPESASDEEFFDAQGLNEYSLMFGVLYFFLSLLYLPSTLSPAPPSPFLLPFPLSLSPTCQCVSNVVHGVVHICV